MLQASRYSVAYEIIKGFCSLRHRVSAWHSLAQNPAQAVRAPATCYLNGRSADKALPVCLLVCNFSTFDSNREAMVAFKDITGFSSLGSYAAGLMQTPQRAMARFGLIRTVEEAEMSKAEGKHELKKVLGVWDLIGMGVGMMIGAGIFVTAGTVAHDYTGPAVLLAFLVAGVSALLSSFIYSEFAVNSPYSGGAFNYILNTFGEFTAWITVMNLIMEYILANAAVMRGFAPYLARLFSLDTHKFITTWDAPNKTYELDWLACGLIVVFTLMLMYGTRESAWFNNALTAVQMFCIIFVIIAGLTKADSDNLTPFFGNFSYRGIFDGASIVFFAYVGFDAVATTAEEVPNPGRTMPLGLLGAMGITIGTYMLMALTLVLMVPYTLIDPAAAFATAFKTRGMAWAQHIVAAGAVASISTSTIVGMIGVSRILCSVAREHLIPPGVAWVHPRFQTPFVATALQGFSTAGIALFTGFDDLMNMVSIGTLFVFWIVALAQIWKRSYVPRVTSRKTATVAALHMVWVVGWSLGFALWYNLNTGSDTKDWMGLVVTGALVFVGAVSMAIFVKPEYNPNFYTAPLYPILPCASIFLNTFLISTLGRAAFIRFGIWSAICVAFYFLYAIHAGTEKDEKRAANAIEAGQVSKKIVA